MRVAEDSNKGGNDNFNNGYCSNNGMMMAGKKTVAMTVRTAGLLWFLYRFPKRFFKLGVRLYECFRGDGLGDLSDLAKAVTDKSVADCAIGRAMAGATDYIADCATDYIADCATDCVLDLVIDLAAEHAAERVEELVIRALKPSSDLLELGLTMTEVQAWRRMRISQCREVIDWLQDPLNRVIGYDDPLYPCSLRYLKDPPLLLFCRGNHQLLRESERERKLAIVGTRLPSHYGKLVVQEWVPKIVTGRQTAVVVSGFAYGIDHLAHQAALAAGGKTIAVLGSGLINIYPKAHAYAWSSEQLAKQALMISEFPLNFPVRPWLFPYRNRIISGLSQAVLVVEAKLRSGTLVTARLAAEQGREVMAVPGSVHNPMSVGCHWLLQQGAALVSGPEEVREILGIADHVDDYSCCGDGGSIKDSNAKMTDKTGNAGKASKADKTNRTSKTDKTHKANRANRAVKAKETDEMDGVNKLACLAEVCVDDSDDLDGAVNISADRASDADFPLECTAKKLLDCLEFGVVNNIEEVLQRTELDLLEVKGILSLLEDSGFVQELVDGYVRLK